MTVVQSVLTAFHKSSKDGKEYGMISYVMENK